MLHLLVIQSTSMFIFTLSRNLSEQLSNLSIFYKKRKLTWRISNFKCINCELKIGMEGVIMIYCVLNILPFYNGLSTVCIAVLATPLVIIVVFSLCSHCSLLTGKRLRFLNASGPGAWITIINKIFSCI